MPGEKELNVNLLDKSDLLERLEVAEGTIGSQIVPSAVLLYAVPRFPDYHCAAERDLKMPVVWSALLIIKRIAESIGHITAFLKRRAGKSARNAFPYKIEIHKVLKNILQTSTTTSLAIKIRGKVNGFLYVKLP